MRTHYLNVDFDLSLRRGGSARPEWARQTNELSLQGLLGCPPDETVVIREPLPAGFVEHLRRHGLETGRWCTPDTLPPLAELDPFGWNADAAALNERSGSRVNHPQLGTVRRVNGKSYGSMLEEELFADDTTAGSRVDSVEALEQILDDVESGTRWIVKAEHGNSALANRRVIAGRLDEQDRRFVADRLEEDPVLVVERWLPRLQDLSAVFRVPFDPESFRLHETRCTDGGALMGVWLEPDPPVDAARLAALAETAARLAARLEHERYAGPVCLDAFVWGRPEAPRLRRLVELNARHALSSSAFRAWRRLAPESVATYRLWARGVLRLPDTLEALMKQLGSDGFDPRTGRGILPVSPTRLADGRPPLKSAWLIFAESRAAVEALEARLRRQFEATA